MGCWPTSTGRRVAEVGWTAVGDAPADLPFEAGVMAQVVRADRDDLARLDSELGQGHGLFCNLSLGVLHVEVVGIVRISEQHSPETESLRFRESRGRWQLGDVFQPAVRHGEPHGELWSLAGLPGR